MFRIYKRTINKLKLSSRTVRLVHREAEASLLALQILLAHADLALRPKRTVGEPAISPRKVLIEIRREMNGKATRRRGELRAGVWRVAGRSSRQQKSPKACREWPRRKPHKPPGPPDSPHPDRRTESLDSNSTSMPHDDRSVTDVGWHPTSGGVCRGVSDFDLDPTHRHQQRPARQVDNPPDRASSPDLSVYPTAKVQSRASPGLFPFGGGGWRSVVLTGLAIAFFGKKLAARVRLPMLIMRKMLAPTSFSDPHNNHAISHQDALFQAQKSGDFGGKIEETNPIFMISSQFDQRRRKTVSSTYQLNPRDRVPWRHDPPGEGGTPGMQITKAVITAAGAGRRQYPASDTVQKAMLPLVDRDGLTKPVLQIIAEEAIESGIEEICVVAAPGRRGRLPPPLPATTPRTSGRPSRASDWAEEQARRLVDLEQRLRFAVQPEPDGYGHAVWCAREFVGGRAVPAAAGRPPLHLERGPALRPAVARPGRGRGLRRLGRAGDPRAPDPPVRHPHRPAARPSGPTSTRSTRSSRSRTRPWPSCGSRSPASARGITSASSACTC